MHREGYVMLRQSLATARLTRLITEDRIFNAPRARISRVHPMLEYLVHCPLCAGVWAAGLVTVADRTPVLRTGVLLLAVAQGGVLAYRGADALG